MQLLHLALSVLHFVYAGLSEKTISFFRSNAYDTNKVTIYPGNINKRVGKHVGALIEDVVTPNNVADETPDIQ